MPVMAAGTGIATEPALTDDMLEVLARHFDAHIVPPGLHRTVGASEPFARNSLDGHQNPVVGPFVDLLVEPHQIDPRVCCSIPYHRHSRRTGLPFLSGQ